MKSLDEVFNHCVQDNTLCSSIMYKMDCITCNLATLRMTERKDLGEACFPLRSYLTSHFSSVRSNSILSENSFRGKQKCFPLEKFDLAKKVLGRTR